MNYVSISNVCLSAQLLPEEQREKSDKDDDNEP